MTPRRARGCRGSSAAPWTANSVDVDPAEPAPASSCPPGPAADLTRPRSPRRTATSHRSRHTRPAAAPRQGCAWSTGGAPSSSARAHRRWQAGRCGRQPPSPRPTGTCSGRCHRPPGHGRVAVSPATSTPMRSATVARGGKGKGAGRPQTTPIDSRALRREYIAGVGPNRWARTPPGMRRAGATVVSGGSLGRVSRPAWSCRGVHAQGL